MPGREGADPGPVDYTLHDRPGPLPSRSLTNSRRDSFPSRRHTADRDGEHLRLEVRPLTAARMEDMGAVLRGTWGSGCWCMYPRLTAEEEHRLPGPGKIPERRRRAMTALARRRRAPGLLAYRNGEPVGWVAIAPRPEFKRTDASKATPPVDDTEVWVIPCITVRRDARGEGVATALIHAAVAYAARHGAPAVEAYPRTGAARVQDDYAFIGTRELFRRAGFRKVRGVLPGLPRGWAPRVTMRIDCRRP